MNRIQTWEASKATNPDWPKAAGHNSARRSVHRGAAVLAAVLALAALVPSTLQAANPLDGTWIQVGNNPASTGAMFAGNCNLSNTCNFDNGTDYWHTFPTGGKILFTTGDGLYWAEANYASVIALVNAAASDFNPNIQWLSAGENGVDLGAAITGNILMRPGFNEDPWVTLNGIHCANGCNEVLWGENGFTGQHAALKNAHGGIKVYIQLPGMIGGTMQMSWLYPDFVTVYNPQVPATGSAIVGSGYEFLNAFTGNTAFNVDISDRVIEIDSNYNNCCFDAVGFNGLRFNGLSGIPAFSSVIVAASNWGVDQSRVTFDPANIYVNFQGLQNQVGLKAFRLVNTPLASIATASLPSGIAGQAYSFALAGTGGSATYTWSATGLPAGFSLSSGGVLNGPASAASFTPSIPITVTDAVTGQTSTTNFSLAIQNTTTTSLGAAPGTTTYGQNVTMTATVTPSNATGTVTFKDGGATLGTGTLNAGTATFSTTALAAGIHPLSAVYAGDSTNSSSTSSPITQTVNPATTTTTLGSSAPTSIFGQSITLTATVSPAAAPGTVTFYDGGSVLGVGTVSGGTATLATRLLSSGGHKLRVLYRGSANFLPSLSPLFNQTVNSASQSGFAPGVVYNTGVLGAWGVVTGDFNADGKTDVAVANYGTTSVSVLLGNGNGSLGASTNFTVPAGPIDVAVGDFNGDGKADLAVTCYDANSVSILIGNGSGGFAAPVNYTSGIGTQPEGIAVSDFNGDGIADLALANNGSATLSVLLGLGNGTFGTGTLYAVGLHPTRPTAADFNGDGITDLAVPGFHAAAAFVLAGRGDGTFSAATSFSAGGTQTYYLGAGDFNGDGAIDFALPNAGTNNVGVLLGIGNGSFGTAATFAVGTFPTSIAVGDFNGDAKLDLVNSNDTNSNATVLLGNGSGSFSALGNFTASGASGAKGVAVGDFNGDGVSDFVITNGGSGTVSMLLGLANTATALTSSVNPTTFGASTTLTATVTPSGATGTVSFFDGVTLLAAVTASGGVATLNTATLTGGSHSLTARYNGAATYNPSTSPALTQVVNPASTTTGLGAAPNPAAPGATVKLTATITPSTATGTVQFKDGAASLGAPQTISGGVATLSTAALTSGAHSLTAVYSGSGNFLTSSSSAVNQVIQNATTNVLTSSSNPSTTGQSVTFTSTITPSSATGTVSFTDNGNPLGNGTLAGGVATLSTAALTAGAHTIIATYAGDANNVGSVSPALTQLVNIATTISLSAAPAATSILGANVTLTATVTPGGATGSVTFYDGTTVLGSSALSGGTATLSTRLLGTGSHKLKAFYRGTAFAPEVIDFTGAPLGPITTTLAGLGANADFTADYIGFGDFGAIQNAGGNNVYGDPTLDNALGAGINLRRTDRSPFSVTQFTLTGNSSTMSFAGAAYSTAGTYNIGNVNNVTSILINIKRGGATPFQVDNIQVSARPTGSTNFLASTSTSLSYTVNSRPQNRFNNGALYNTGLTPWGSAIGDLNGDGVPDFVVANYGANTISVLLGTGGGVLGTASTITVGTNPFAVALADFNNDGKADIAVSNLISSSISILIGNGLGGFAAPVDYTAGVGGHPDYIVAADFNGDGFVDLATANFLSSNVSVLLGTGTGTFGPGAIYPVGNSPAGLVAGDFNNDGKTDLATANQITNNVSVLLGAGGGAFAAAVNYSAGGTGQQGLAAADVNADGNLDLAVTNATSNSVTLLLGSGSGTFGTPNTIASTLTPFSATPGDFNGDGKVDFALSTDTSSGAVILIGDGVGGFATNCGFSDPSAAGSHGVAVGDLNSDGISDIVISDFAGNAASVFLGLANTTTALTSSVNPSTFGGSTTLTATVTPSTATGTVVFLDFGEITVGKKLTSPTGQLRPIRATLSGGVATLNVSSLALGSHSLTAFYTGDAGNAPSASTAVTQVVNQAPTTTSLGSSANPSVFLANVTLTATVSPSTATGTITFKDGAATLGTGTLSAGTATFTFVQPSVGAHSLTAVYSGDVNFLTSTSSALTQTVNKATPGIILTSTPNPVNLGQNVDLTATVTPGIATGTVTFKDGANTLGTANLSGGVATFSTSALPVGTRSLTAVYGGDGSFLTNTSAALNQTVRHLIFSDNFNSVANPLWANEVGNWSTAAGVYDAASPSSTPNAHSLLPFILRDFTVHVDATVAGDGGVWLRASNNGGTGVGVNGILLVIRSGAGDIYFHDVQNGIYGVQLGVTALTAQPHTFDIVVSGNTYTVFADGSSVPITSITNSSWTSGQTGLYETAHLGFDNFALYDSTTPTTLGLTSSINPTTFGQSSVLTATVTPSSATGTVTFQDGVATLGTATLTGGVATFGTASLLAGSHPIVATYGGDTNFFTSSSAPVVQVVNQAFTTTTLSSSANPSTFGQNVTLTATVSPSTATGTVFFKEGTTTIGTGTLSGGTATFSISTLSVVGHSLTAVYNGDANFFSSASSALTQTVNAASTTISLSASPNPSGYGQAVTLTATVAPSAATGTVTFRDGSTVLGTGTLTAGVATLSVSTLLPGSHALTAAYSGDASYSASASASGGPSLTFTAPVPGTILDTAGVGTGFTTRLPGTGSSIPVNDPNFNVNTTTGRLTWRTVASDLNGQGNLAAGDYVGFPLSAAGVTLNKDFTVSATYRNLQFGLNFDQIGVFVGTNSTTAFRAGLVVAGAANAFTVQTVGGGDSGGVLNSALAPSVGHDVTFTLSRTAGVWSFNVQNLTVPARSGNVAITQPTFLNNVSNLVAGVFAANTGNGTVRTETLSAFSVGSAQGVVLTVNQTPTTTTLTSSGSLVPFGQTVTFTATVAPSGATGTVTFKDGAATIGTGTINAGVATLALSSLAIGTHNITAVYGGDPIFATSVSTVLAQLVDKITTSTSLTASPGPSSGVGQQVTLTATVTPNPGSGTVSFLDGALTLGTANLTNGVATLSTSALTAGSHSLRASFAGNASNFASTSATISQSVTYPPLSITTGSLPTGALGQPYGPAALSATGGTGSFYSWSASGLPPGLGLSASGTLGGTPTAGFSGSINVTVTDASAGLSASRSFPLTITVSTLTINGPASLGNVLAGGTVSGSYTASGGVPPYTWSLGSAPGISVDSNGRVNGTLSRPGSFVFSLTVTDSASNSANLGLSASAFGIVTGGLPPASTGADYSATISAVGGTPPYTFSGAGLPAGLTFSNGTISGRPTSPGQASISVTASDSGGLSTSASFSLTVTGTVSLRIFSTSAADGTVGQPYSAPLAASGGAPPYTWSQTTGALPEGLSFSPSGTVSGLPTTPGPYQIGVQVTDSTGGQAVGAISIQILPAPLQIISGATLPDGIVGVEFPSQVLSAAGGIPPYTFTARGSLPAGLTLSGGQIGGTPSGTPGSSTFTLVVSDSATPPATGLLGTSVNIRPNSPDLTLSSGSLRFSLTAGSGAPPSPASVIVGSSAVSQVISFSVSSSVPWISATGAGSTPGPVSVGLNNAALALSAAGSPYSGIVTITCTSEICAGKSQQINVGLTMAVQPPQLSVDTALLSFVALSTNPQSSTGSLSISNAGGGTLQISSVSAAAPWLSVAGAPSELRAGPGTSVNVTADPAGLAPGYYRSTINVASSAGSASVPVTLLISGAATMTLGPSGTQFSMPQGGVLGNSRGSFSVAVAGGSASYEASLVSGAPWLTLSGASGSASSASPGTVSFGIDQAQAAALREGAYYATIRVAAAGLVNSPQDFQVILNISPAASAVVPDPQPAGLVFLSSGAGSLPPQVIQLFASSRTAIPFQASASAEGGNWLSISPTTGSTSAASPGQVSVSANASGLRPGAYRGTVSFAFAGAAVRTVNVTLIVQAIAIEPSPVSGLRPSISARPTAACASATLVPTQTGLVNNFSAPASWPTPLAIKLFDSCGSAVGNGQIVATFSNGDSPLILSAVNPGTGLYSGTWTPRKASAQVTISAQASASGYPAATVKLAGQVSPNSAPVLAANGTQDVFHPQVGGGLGPGNIVQIYGSGLASQIASPKELPLPTALSGSSVLIGGVEAPLFYVSPGQINAQIPFELTAGNQYQVIVSANGALTTPQPIQLTAAAPSILEFRSGAVVAQHLDGSLISDTAPGAPGEHVVIYLSGLGATDIKVPSGTASPSSPPARVLDVPVVTMNDKPVTLEFAGLAPSLVGLYQVNFQIPTDAVAANYSLVIAQNGVSSNRTILPVKP